MWHTQYIFKQKTWSLPQELSILQNIHNDFIGFGMSAVDTTENILVGRPLGSPEPTIASEEAYSEWDKKGTVKRDLVVHTVKWVSE